MEKLDHRHLVWTSSAPRDALDELWRGFVRSVQVPTERHSSFWHVIDDALLDMRLCEAQLATLRDFETSKMCQAPSSPCHVQVQSSSCSYRATPRLRLGELFEAQGVCMVSSPTQLPFLRNHRVCNKFEVSCCKLFTEVSCGILNSC